MTTLLVVSQGVRLHLTLRVTHRFKAFRNKILVKILQTETGGNRKKKKLNNDELYNLLFLQNIISVMRWVGEVIKKMHTEL
jgi:phage repressor protein C with HTH and peptisase S24 domain